MWRKFFDAYGLRFTVERFEIFLPVPSKECWILCNAILDHLESNARECDGVRCEREESRLINLVLCVVLAADTDSLAFDIFNVKVLFPAVCRTNLFQDVGQLLAQFVKAQRRAVVFSDKE